MCWELGAAFPAALSLTPALYLSCFREIEAEVELHCPLLWEQCSHAAAHSMKALCCACPHFLALNLCLNCIAGAEAFSFRE